jgi:hypothetical protein
MRPLLWSIAYVSLLISSCQTDDLARQCADPIGSDEYECSNETVFCFQPEVNGCFQFLLENSTAIIRSVNLEGHVMGMIADYGEVACLSLVRPGKELDFKLSVEAQLHHGYVVRFSDETYARFFIESYESNGYGNIQINIIRHYTF